MNQKPSLISTNYVHLVASNSISDNSSRKRDSN